MPKPSCQKEPFQIIFLNMVKVMGCRLRITFTSAMARDAADIKIAIL